MTKNELIAKQQLEIEELKIVLGNYKAECKDALMYLNRPEQWSMKCPDFPRVAMQGIVNARKVLENI